jgi:hypothetical protein
MPKQRLTAVPQKVTTHAFPGTLSAIRSLLKIKNDENVRGYGVNKCLGLFSILQPHLLLENKFDIKVISAKYLPTAC